MEFAVIILRPFDEDTLIPNSTSITEVVLRLDRFPRLFVRSLGTVAGVVTRADLQDPPVRMWLFGMITVLEMRFLHLIEANFSDELGALPLPRPPGESAPVAS